MGQLCAVTPITKYELGFRHQVLRLATSVVGNVRKGLNCEKEVQKNETLRHLSPLTRVVLLSQEMRSRSNSVVLTLKFSRCRDEKMTNGFMEIAISARLLN